MTHPDFKHPAPLPLRLTYPSADLLTHMPTLRSLPSTLPTSIWSPTHSLLYVHLPLLNTSYIPDTGLDPQPLWPPHHWAVPASLLIAALCLGEGHHFRHSSMESQTEEDRLHLGQGPNLTLAFNRRERYEGPFLIKIFYWFILNVYILPVCMSIKHVST